MFRNVTVAGFGTVGTAVKFFLDSNGVRTTVYDPPKGFGDESVLRDADAVFIAVPTPHTDNGFDSSYVGAVLDRIAPGIVVVIKSTVTPGSTEEFQRRYPQLRVVFNPEFLTEKTARQDFLNPTRQIVGYTRESREIADALLAFLPDAPLKHAMPATEAEMVKYMNNVFYAVKVTFANQVYDVCEKLGIDYDNVAHAAVSSEPMMGKNHWDVFYGGYRGYGGKCLPKDVRSLIDIGKRIGADVSWLECMEQMNNTRRDATNIPNSF